jgi:hypothetical protein
MILWMNRAEFVGVIVAGVAIGVLLPAVADPAVSILSRFVPWMKVTEIKVALIAAEPVVTAHREVRRMVVGGRYGVELYEVTARGKRQVCTGGGVATYDPDEPSLIGPISLERWMGGKSGTPMQCLPLLEPSRRYELVTVWCLPSSGGCDGKVAGPRVAFELAPDWSPPAAGTLVR